MSSARTQVGSTVTAFFSWWGTELAGLLPRALTRNGQSTGPHRIVSIEDGGLRLITPGGTSANGHGHPGDELLSTADAIAKLTRDNGRAASLIGVRLPYRACFSRRVELPTAAARDFPRLLALDLERATPFKPHDVRTAFFIEEAQRTPGKTAIRQLVAKRAGLDATIAALQDAGLTVTQADCWNADGQTKRSRNSGEALNAFTVSS